MELLLTTPGTPPLALAPLTPRRPPAAALPPSEFLEQEHPTAEPGGHTSFPSAPRNNLNTVSGTSRRQVAVERRVSLLLYGVHVAYKR